MARTATTRYDVAEHLRTPEGLAAYLEACVEEANSDATFVASPPSAIRRQGRAQAIDLLMSRRRRSALQGEFLAAGIDTRVAIRGGGCLGSCSFIVSSRC